MNSSVIKVIFFDAVGTLFDVRGSVGEVYVTYAKKYGVPDTQDMVIALNRAFQETVKEMPPPIFSVERPEKLKQCERLWWFDVVHAVFYRVGMFEGFDDFFDEVFEAFGHASSWQLYAETIDVLTELKSRGFELGIISNFDTRFYQVMRALHIDHFFDSITLSSLAGAAKPARKIFCHALEEHLIDPHEALHIGDHRLEDFDGARQAGLNAVLVDRKKQSMSESPTLTLSSLQAIFELPFLQR